MTGDAACMMENLTIPTPPGTHIASGVALASLKKISDLSDRVLMNHDPELKRYQSSGFPVTPEVTPSLAISDETGGKGSHGHR